MYDVLDPAAREIRLLSLNPGCFLDDIHCTLLTSSLDDVPSYEALSYVWGCADHTRVIFLNDRIWTVTLNLEFALRSLRPKGHEARILWVDALCIDQTNFAERSQQVSIMRDIYENALNTLVWLGKSGLLAHEFDESAILGAFDIIRSLAANLHLEDITIFRNATRCLSAPQSRTWTALRHIWQHPYWKRAWVVQETAVARHPVVVLGVYSMEFEDFLAAALNLTKHIQATCCFNHWLALPLDMTNGILIASGDIYPLYSIRKRTNCKEAPPLILWELLLAFRPRQSTDPRDKVYAFLGLVSQRLQQDSLSVDYLLDAASLFKRTTLKIITEMETLHILLECSRGPRSLRLPSWIPDFSCPGSGAASVEMAGISERLYSASGLSTCQPSIYGDNTLCVQGIKVDTVQGVSLEGAEPFETIANWRSQVMELCNFGQELEGAEVVGRGLHNAFLRTLVSDMIAPITERLTEYGNNISYRRASETDIERFEIVISEHMRHSSEWSTTLLMTASVPEQELWFSFSAARAENRNFFLTSKNLMGTTSADVRPGDEVWVLMGSPVPFVLRPLADCAFSFNTLSLYSLEGHCFCHGIMDGEAAQEGLAQLDSIGLL